MEEHGQGSLFDASPLVSGGYTAAPRRGGKDLLQHIVAAAMVEPGYYFIENVPVRVERDTKTRFYTLTALRGRKQPNWLIAITLHETATKWVFDEWWVSPAHDAAVLYNNLIQLMAHPSMYRRAWAQEFDRCSECGRKLTNEKSRHYALGKECILKRPDLVNQIDAENDGLSWEALQK